MLAGHIGGVIAQRLVRKLCPHCKQMRRATDEEAKILHCVPVPFAVHVVPGFAEAQSPYMAPSAQNPMIAVPKGCDACNNTGYKGRIVISEILRVTPEIDDMIAKDAPRMAMLECARAAGFRPMAEDGIAKVLAGDISLEGLRRAVDLTRSQVGSGGGSN